MSLLPKEQNRLWEECRKFLSCSNPKTTSGTHRYTDQANILSVMEGGKKDVSSEKMAFVDHNKGGVAELITDDII